MFYMFSPLWTKYGCFLYEVSNRFIVVDAFYRDQQTSESWIDENSSKKASRREKENDSPAPKKVKKDNTEQVKKAQ